MNDLTKLSLRPIAIFLSITFALSALFYFLIIYSGTLRGGWGKYIMGIMWCPGIAALITMKILKRDISELGWKWGDSKYQIRSFLIPILYGLAAYLVIWLFGWGGFYNHKFVEAFGKSLGLGPMGDGFTIAIYLILTGTLGIIGSAATALGEEIGWRGFLVPELFKSQGFTKTSFITGTIWGIWHMPILLFADYNSGTPSWYAMTCFMVMVVSISFIYTWFRMKSGSLWTAVILHAAHNLYIQTIFTPLTSDTGNTAYYIDEFGIVVPIVTIGFAVYYWTKRDQLKPVSNNKSH